MILTLKDVEHRLVEAKAGYDKCNTQLADLKEQYEQHIADKDLLGFTEQLTHGATVESFQQAVDTLKIKRDEYASTYRLIKAVKNQMLLEKADEFTIPDEYLMDPKSVDLKDLVKKNAEAKEAKRLAAEEEERRAVALDKWHEILDQVQYEDDKFHYLVDELVPVEGEADTLAGELLRAIMWLLHRDYNDGDKFYMGYGLESCGSAAAFLADHGYEEPISSMIDNFRYDDDINDEFYTKELKELAELITTDILNSDELYLTKNTENCHNTNYDWIEENQPRFDYSFALSDKVKRYLEETDCTTSDIAGYLDFEDWDNTFDDVEVNVFNSGVELSNLTYDGFVTIQDWVEPYSKFKTFWEDIEDSLKDEFGELKDEDEEDEDKDDDDEEESLEESLFVDKVEAESASYVDDDISSLAAYLDL